MKILIIDDDERLARCIGRMLRAHDVTVEPDPKAALDLLRNGAWFDLILCDLNMPGTRGTEVLDHVRDRLGADAPMLVLMSGADPIMFSGADALLSKPFRAEDLQSIVVQVIALRERRDHAKTITMHIYP